MRSKEQWQTNEGWVRKPPEGYESLDPSKCDQSALQSLREIFRKQLFPIYLYGSTGVGKSFLSALVYVRYGIKGDPFYDAWFMRYSDLRDETMRQSKNGLPGPWERMGRDKQLIVIDEIGSGEVSETRNELLWKILELRRGKPLIITSNLYPKELRQRFDTRIESRILQGALVELVGADQRAVGLENRSFKVGGKK